MFLPSLSFKNSFKTSLFFKILFTLSSLKALNFCTSFVHLIRTCSFKIVRFFLKNKLCSLKLKPDVTVEFFAFLRIFFSNYLINKVLKKSMQAFFMQSIAQTTKSNKMQPSFQKIGLKIATNRSAQCYSQTKLNNSLSEKKNHAPEKKNSKVDQTRKSRRLRKLGLKKYI